LSTYQSHRGASSQSRRACHHRHGRRGGRCHRRTVVTPASPPPPPPPPPSAVPHHRVLEHPPSPSPDRPTYRPTELSDPDAHPRGHLGGSCAVQSWDCPNRVAPVHGPSSSSHQGEEEEGGEEKDDEHRITVVTGPVGASVIHRTVLISIDPRG
jgi:hypothetical protein